MLNKAIFIDKDGTLIPDVPYNVNPDRITLSDGAESLKLLQDQGYLLVIISNQAGVARGYFKEEELSGVTNKIISLLQDIGIHLHGFYYCPHHPEGLVAAYAIVCECRKPGFKMITNAATQLKIDISKSWMVGDILNDVEAGKRAGCRTILIDNGNETEWILSNERNPDFKAKDLKQVTDTILSADIVSNGMDSGKL